MTTKNVIVADIDACCIDITERLPHYLNGDEDTFHDNFHLDSPIPQGTAIYKKFLHDPDYRFVFVTGRPERARDYTLTQLRSFIDPFILSSQLLMRPEDPTDLLSDPKLPDSDLKPLLLLNAGIAMADIFIVFDDRQSVVDNFRQLGIVVYQTAAIEGFI